MKRAALLLLLLAALPLSARMRAVRSSTVETPASWLRARAVPALDPGDAQVVALGDVTHATHEIYAAKQVIVPQLVARGFRVLAFEAPYTEYKALDDYVLHGTGDPAAALNLPLYWFWDTNEILELVQWARAQNAAGLTPPIRIEGVDPTSPRVTAAEVVAYLRRVDPAFAASAEATYRCIREGYGGAEWCRRDIAAIRTVMEARRAQYELASSAEEFEEMLHAARVVEQGERVLAEGFNVRDEPMAENILRRVARGEKVIVIGHNEHWGRTPYVLDDPHSFIRSAGSILGERLGDRYFVLGSLLLEGTFLAVEYTPGVRSGEIRLQTMTAPSHDDFALLLSQSRLDSMILPLRGVLPAWLAGTHRLRFAGSTVPSRDRATLDVPADLGKKFDAVLYVKTSTPTQLRHWPRF
ncbi:MAG TPA: erythromycin esterase family protein [Thermoanaerobaculia bacterium]|nr:erythromycin esterase family protein [Thermoanaerobaculia bacterium]